MTAEVQFESLHFQESPVLPAKLFAADESPSNLKMPSNSECPTRAGSTDLDNLPTPIDPAPKSSEPFTKKGIKSFYNFEIISPEDNRIIARIVSEPMPEPQSPVVREKVLGGWILLNPGISKTNFYSSLMFAMYFGAILISFSTLEPEYISQTFNISAETMGRMTAELYLIDYLIRLCFAMIWGPCIDRFGRKFVLTIGIVLMSIGYLIIPFLEYSLFSGYLLGKSFISCGVIAISMMPFAADYVDNSTKGVMTGINFAVGFIGGALSGLLMKTLLSFGFSCKEIYWIYAPILLAIGFMVRAGIKGGNTYYKIKEATAEVVINREVNTWKEVKKAYRDIPWVSIGVLFGILGNTDFYIMTTGLMIWLKSILPADQDPTLYATNFQIIFFGLSVLTTLGAALKIDKVSHMKVIFPVLIISALGFVIIPFTKDPQSILLYIFFVIEGLSLPGVFVFSTYLAMRYNPPEIRGTLSAVGNGVGFLGAIIILSLGGYLHDHWRTDASFILYGGLLFFTLFMVSIIFANMLRSKKRSNDADNVQLNIRNQDIVG